MGEHRIAADAEQDRAASEVNDEWGAGEVDESRQRLVGTQPGKQGDRQVGRKAGIIKIDLIQANIQFI